MVNSFLWDIFFQINKHIHQSKNNQFVHVYLTLQNMINLSFSSGYLLNKL